MFFPEVRSEGRLSNGNHGGDHIHFIHQVIELCHTRPLGPRIIFDHQRIKKISFRLCPCITLLHFLTQQVQDGPFL